MKLLSLTRNSSQLTQSTRRAMSARARGETHGDKLYGRGTSDMKSGVAAMTVMALRLAKISHRRAGMMLIFTAGEEITCVDAYAEIAKAWCGV
jgi:acetylornithine deacetylase/succinyl-diaminopimelate desuccinylase-like protein